VDEETTKSQGHGSHEKLFIEDYEGISAIFDKHLFSKINEVEHIKATERQLEAMKVEIKDKKRLQKERNVLTA